MIRCDSCIMNDMKLSVLIFLVLLSTTSVHSQKSKKQGDTSDILVQTKRIEFEKEGNWSDFTLVNAGKYGLLVLENTDNTDNSGNTQWKFSLLDTGLNVVRDEWVFLPIEYSLYGYSSYRDDFYLLFQKNFYRAQEFSLIKFSVGDHSLESFDLTTVFPVEITHFEAVDDMILIAGYANYRPVVITYNINDRIPRILPGYYDNKNDILDVEIDRENKLFTILTLEKVYKRYHSIRFRTYTNQGDLVLNSLIDPGNKKSVIDASITRFSGGLQYVAGTYSKKSLEYSHGFYLSRFINGQQQVQRYFPFSELENFFGYLKPKKEEKIKGRIKRKKAKGKTKKFSYQLLVNDIIESENGYIMVAEAYYPRYYTHTSNPSLFGFGSTAGWTRFRNTSVRWYVWTHAVVVGFDRNCNILWDHSFKIEDKRSLNLEKTVGIIDLKDEIVLNYLEDNEIRSKVISSDEIVEGKTFNPIMLQYESDEIKDLEVDGQNFAKWFDNVSIAYGEQNIQSTVSQEGKGSRKVFYINKIQYRLK